MFLIDIPFKGCQGRSNRSSIVHAVSLTPHAPCMPCQRPRMHLACYVNDTAFILKNSNIFANTNLNLLLPLNQGPRTDVLMKKLRVENLVTLSL
jgi:hypothetical protein